MRITLTVRLADLVKLDDQGEGVGRDKLLDGLLRDVPLHVAPALVELFKDGHAGVGRDLVLGQDVGGAGEAKLVVVHVVGSLDEGLGLLGLEVLGVERRVVVNFDLA